MIELGSEKLTREARRLREDDEEQEGGEGQNRHDRKELRSPSFFANAREHKHSTTRGQRSKEEEENIKTKGEAFDVQKFQEKRRKNGENKTKERKAKKRELECGKGRSRVP